MIHNIKTYITTVSCLALFAILFTSCDKQRVFDENQKLKDRSWDAAAPLVFNVAVTDTVSSYNMYVNIRNSDTYKFSNLYIFMTTTLPHGEIEKDTLQLVLANDAGKWLGNGLGDIFESRILFKQNLKFINSGNYSFKLEQAMRLNPLPGILDVGIRLEKAQ